ncbi:MAG: HAD family phosphatase [Caldilineales bacterium]|nr:HAD family phosphatase [Caldilineales bacterium]
MIRAVVFDFGGVLVDERAAAQRLAGWEAHLGWPPGSLRQHLYSGAAWEAVSTGQISMDAYWARVGAPLAAALPAAFSAYRDSFHGAQLDAGMTALAWQLRARFALALLSNATLSLGQRLQQETDLAGLFDVVVISAVEGTRKPEPAIYRLVWQRLGLPPAACLLIDDKERNTAAALALGMPAIVHRSVAETAQALRDLGILAG